LSINSADTIIHYRLSYLLKYQLFIIITLTYLLLNKTIIQQEVGVLSPFGFIIKPMNMEISEKVKSPD